MTRVFWLSQISSLSDESIGQNLCGVVFPNLLTNKLSGKTLGHHYALVYHLLPVCQVTILYPILVLSQLISAWVLNDQTSFIPPNFHATFFLATIIFQELTFLQLNKFVSANKVKMRVEEEREDASFHSVASLLISFMEKQLSG